MIWPGFLAWVSEIYSKVKLGFGDIIRIRNVPGVKQVLDSVVGLVDHTVM